MNWENPLPPEIPLRRNLFFSWGESGERNARNDTFPKRNSGLSVGLCSGFPAKMALNDGETHSPFVSIVRGPFRVSRCGTKSHQQLNIDKFYVQFPLVKRTINFSLKTKKKQWDLLLQPRKIRFRPPGKFPPGKTENNFLLFPTRKGTNFFFSSWINSRKTYNFIITIKSLIKNLMCYQ